MKITLNDGGYLEFQKSRKPHHVYVLIGARKADNPLELLVNSVEIPLKQLIEGIESVLGPVILKKGSENE